jgi:hypothetical protein
MDILRSVKRRPPLHERKLNWWSLIMRLSGLQKATNGNISNALLKVTYTFIDLVEIDLPYKKFHKSM